MQRDVDTHALELHLKLGRFFDSIVYCGHGVHFFIVVAKTRPFKAGKAPLRIVEHRVAVVGSKFFFV